MAYWCVVVLPAAHRQAPACRVSVLSCAQLCCADQAPAMCAVLCCAVQTPGSNLRDMIRQLIEEAKRIAPVPPMPKAPTPPPSPPPEPELWPEPEPELQPEPAPVLAGVCFVLTAPCLALLPACLPSQPSWLVSVLA